MYFLSYDDWMIKVVRLCGRWVQWVVLVSENCGMRWYEKGEQRTRRWGATNRWDWAHRRGMVVSACRLCIPCRKNCRLFPFHWLFILFWAQTPWHVTGWQTAGTVHRIQIHTFAMVQHSALLCCFFCCRNEESWFGSGAHVFTKSVCNWKLVRWRDVTARRGGLRLRLPPPAATSWFFTIIWLRPFI